MDIFESLIANDNSKAVLTRLAREGRLPQAILIEGPRGSGRFSLARMISALGVCRRSGCGECPDCRMALGGRHPDVEVYAKADAAGALTIKSLRGINETVATPPVQAARRVVILRDIQDAAQIRTLNALLKVIEEPPDYLMFIITADCRDNILPTILSRCLLLRMELPDAAACARAALRLAGRETDDGDADALRLAALTGGNIGRTAALLSDSPEAKAMNGALELYDCLLTGDSYAVLRFLQQYERNRAGYRELVACLREVFGQVVSAKYRDDPYFSEQGRRITAAQGLRVLDVLDAASREARQNINLPLALTRLGMSLHRALRA